MRNERMESELDIARPLVGFGGMVESGLERGAEWREELGMNESRF